MAQGRMLQSLMAQSRMARVKRRDNDMPYLGNTPLVRIPEKTESDDWFTE